MSLCSNAEGISQVCKFWNTPFPTEMSIFALGYNARIIRLCKAVETVKRMYSFCHLIMQE